MFYCFNSCWYLFHLYINKKQTIKQTTTAISWIITNRVIVKDWSYEELRLVHFKDKKVKRLFCLTAVSVFENLRFGNRCRTHSQRNSVLILEMTNWKSFHMKKLYSSYKLMLFLFTVSSKKRGRNEDFSYKRDGFSDQMAKYMLIQSLLAFSKCTVGCRLFHDAKFLYFFLF